MLLNRLDKFHKTKLGLFVFGLLELAAAYAFFGLSVDRGNFWWYLLTLVLLVGGLQNIFKLISLFFKNGKSKTSPVR